MASEEARAKGEETREHLDEFRLDAERRIERHDRLFLVVRRRRIEGDAGVFIWHSTFVHQSYKTLVLPSRRKTRASKSRDHIRGRWKIGNLRPAFWRPNRNFSLMPQFLTSAHVLADGFCTVKRQKTFGGCTCRSRFLSCRHFCLERAFARTTLAAAAAAAIKCGPPSPPLTRALCAQAYRQRWQK